MDNNVMCADFISWLEMRKWEMCASLTFSSVKPKKEYTSIFDRWLWGISTFNRSGQLIEYIQLTGKRLPHTITPQYFVLLRNADPQFANLYENSWHQLGGSGRLFLLRHNRFEDLLKKFVTSRITQINHNRWDQAIPHRFERTPTYVNECCLTTP